MVDLTPFPTPGVTPANWGAQNNSAVQTRYLDALEQASDGDEVLQDQLDVLNPVTEEILPSPIIEGRSLYQYGPSRGVATTAMRLHFSRLRRRIGSGTFAQYSVGGYQASEAAAYGYGTFTASRLAAQDSDPAPSVGVGTWVNAANQGGIFLMWPFGADALYDGRTDHNSTTTKARTGAQVALHAMIALVRAELRLQSALSGSFSITNGSPLVTGGANPFFRGMLVQGTGIPANTYVGTVTGITTFRLSSSRTSQVDVNATATNAAASLTFSPVYTGTWSAATNTALSGGSALKTHLNGGTSTYVLWLDEPRRVHWVTTAIDDAEYVVAGTPLGGGGTGGGDYSIVVDGGTPIVGTTSNQARYGQATGLTFGPQAVDLGTLGVGTHTIAITANANGKILTDDCLLVEALYPITTTLVKEVELPDQYYINQAATNVTYATTLIYNDIIDAEAALWPSDESVIVLDPQNDFGYDRDIHVSAADGGYVHFNDLGERVMADGILKAWNELGVRNGLVKL